MEAILALAAMAIVMSDTQRFPPYQGEDAAGHQGFWNGAEQPHACLKDGVNPKWTVGKKLCSGVHYRYYLSGNGFVGGMNEGNDPCRADPWDRNSAWICR